MANYGQFVLPKNDFQIAGNCNASETIQILITKEIITKQTKEIIYLLRKCVGLSSLNFPKEILPLNGISIIKKKLVH